MNFALSQQLPDDKGLILILKTVLVYPNIGRIFDI